MDHNQIMNEIANANLTLAKLGASDKEYIHLYPVENFNVDGNKELRKFFAKCHKIIIDAYLSHNHEKRISGGFFSEGKEDLLLDCLKAIYTLQKSIENSPQGFKIDEYYDDIFKQSIIAIEDDFFATTSTIDFNIILPLKIPIFSLSNKVKVSHFLANGAMSNLCEIGKGSYGTVYKFHDPFLNRDLALKKANVDLNSEEIERFALEFQTLNDLDSPYIVEVYNFDKESNHYTMEYFPHSLSDYYNQQDISMEIRISIAKQVCSAVDYMISKKTYHRDLSPNNVLIKKYGDGSVVAKLSDFGLVKIPDSTKTKYQTNPKGSYIPIEIALRRVSYDKYGDLQEIWSLTCLLFFIMNGFDFEDMFDDNNVYIDAYKAGTNETLEQRTNNVPELLKLFLDAASRVNS